jgi:hypothetical protein
MAYVAIPDDVILKKVTAAQKAAVDEYLGRERRSGYFENLFRNPTTPPIIAGVAFLASAPTLLRLIFEALEKNGNGNGFKAPTKVEYATFTKDFTEGFLDFIGAGKEFGLNPFEGEAKDFWSKYVRK